MSKKTKLPSPRIEVFQQKDGNWHFRVIHDNGAVANHSYASKRGAKSGVTSMLFTCNRIWNHNPNNIFVVDSEGNVLK